MAVSTDNNISVKEYYIINKCKDLKIETEKMWQLKTTIVPVTVGGARSVMVIVVGNGRGDTSSNPERDW